MFNFIVVSRGGKGGVGEDHVHYEALTEIFLLNIILLSVESSKSLNNDCNVIIDGYCYCWRENRNHHTSPSPHIAIAVSIITP